MPGHVKVGGSWKSVATPSVKVGGSWKAVDAGYTKVAGAWKQWYSAVGPSTYELIQSINVASPTGSVNFTSIPQGYESLQIRMSVRTNSTASTDGIGIRFNNDSSASYNQHLLYGFSSGGQNLLSINQSSLTKGYAGYTLGSTAVANTFSVSITDIADYSSSKVKIAKTFTGRNNGVSTDSLIGLQSSAWFNTAAITSIELSSIDSSAIVAGSRFSLYGIRG